MKRSVAIMIAVIILTAGAGSALLMAYGHLGPKTIPPDVAAFPIADAQALMERTEATVLTLSRCPPQPGQQQEARQMLLDTYGESAGQVWACFYDDELEAPGADPAYNQQGVLFPLIYHQSIEIVQAYLEVTHYPEEGTVRELVIRERYTGDDPLLEGFWRENIFREDNGDWRFHRFRGTISLTHEDLFSVYLPMKGEYQWQ